MLRCCEEGEGHLKGIFLCSTSPPEQGGGAFIKAGVIIMMFTVCFFPMLVTWDRLNSVIRPVYRPNYPSLHYFHNCIYCILAVIRTCSVMSAPPFLASNSVRRTPLGYERTPKNLTKIHGLFYKKNFIIHHNMC